MSDDSPLDLTPPPPRQRSPSDNASSAVLFWFGSYETDVQSVVLAHVLSVLSITVGLVAGALFVFSYFPELGFDRTLLLTLLYEIFIPWCSSLGFFLTCMLAVRSFTTVVGDEGKTTGRYAKQARRFGRKSFLICGSSVLFAFSCFYRAINIADEGAATCRGEPTVFNAPVSGRAVATVGEVALVVQFAIYIEETSIRLNTQRGLWAPFARKFTNIPFSTLVPVLLAETASWTGVLSGNSVFYCVEYVLWMIISITWAWDGAELFIKSVHWKDKVMHACLVFCGLSLFSFNALLEIPHFFFYSRDGTPADKPSIGVWECLQEKESPLWVKRLPFFFCYFIGCSWSSAVITYRFLRRNKPKAQLTKND